MPRLVGTAFQGVSPHEADSAQFTWRRVYRRIIEDLALIYDRVTGQNSPVNPIDHSGGGNGARLGMPIVNQWIGRTVHVNGTGGGKNGGDGRRAIVAMPIFIPKGTGTIFVRLGVKESDSIGLAPWRVRILDSGTGSDLVSADMSMFQNAMHAYIPTATPGRSVLLIEATMRIGDSGSVFLGSLFVGEARGGLTADILPSGRRGQPGTNDIGIFVPLAAEALRWTEYDDSEVDASLVLPLSGRITGPVNRNINGMFEFLTGSIPIGNVDYVQVDHDSGGTFDPVNPSRSRFSASTRSLLPNEPLVEFPAKAECFGAFDTLSGYIGIDARPPNEGSLDWYGIVPTVVTTQTVIETEVMLPDFPSGGATNNLKVDILFGSRSAVPTAWTVTVATGVDSASGAVPAALANSSRLRLLTLALDYVADDVNLLSISLSRTGVLGAVDELVLLGYCAYFDWA